MDTIRLDFGAMMASDWDKTRPNIRVPRDEPEEDFGSTVVGYRFQEEEAPRQKNPPPQQQPPQKQGGGIPGWVWGVIAGFGGLIFLIVAAVALYFILRPDPGFTLIIEGAPPNSRIFIGANERCVSSERGTYKCTDIRSGKRNLRITSDGYTDYESTVTGKDGEEVKHIASMTKSNNGNGNKNGNKNGNNNGNDNRGGGVEDEIEKTGRVNLTVNFKSGEAIILPISFTPLDEVVAILKKHPDWQIRVEGHTDNKGNATYNQNLSEARAASVMKYFTDRGIAQSRLTSKGFGLSSPIAGTVQNQTEEERTKNRRVTLVKTN